MIDPLILATGLLAALTVVLLLDALRPAPPSLAVVIRRLDATADSRTAATDGWWGRRWWATHAPDLAERLGLGRYAADLAVLDEPPTMLLARKCGYSLLGLAFAPVLATAMSLIGLTLPVAIPAAASLILAAGLFWAPDLDLTRRARTARYELRQTLATYLDLVALERAADAGASEALHRAAAVGDGTWFARLRDTLLHARVATMPPWIELADLGEKLRVPELGDLATLMRMSGEDGAAVYTSLRARADALHTALLAEDTAAANAATEHLVIPVALLGLTFLALLAIPAALRLTGTT